MTRATPSSSWDIVFNHLGSKRALGAPVPIEKWLSTWIAGDSIPPFLEQAIFHGVSVESEGGVNRAAHDAGHRLAVHAVSSE
jgi:hypothetical protein